MADRLDSRDLVKERDELGNDLEYPGYFTEEQLADIKLRHTLLGRLLQELEDNCEADPEDDAIQMIPKDDFEEYAKEYADECGYMALKIDRDVNLWPIREPVDVTDQWPFKFIDWKAAADDLAEGYVEIEWAGVTYLCQ